MSAATAIFANWRNCNWDWYRCPCCKRLRWLPVHWEWHTCEPCSARQHTMQMIRLGEQRV